jgi:hypothetical protein
VLQLLFPSHDNAQSQTYACWVSPIWRYSLDAALAFPSKAVHVSILRSNKSCRRIYAITVARQFTFEVWRGFLKRWWSKSWLLWIRVWIRNGYLNRRLPYECGSPVLVVIFGLKGRIPCFRVWKQQTEARHHNYEMYRKLYEAVWGCLLYVTVKLHRSVTSPILLNPSSKCNIAHSVESVIEV